ncbi:hypothetical protein [Micromonospora sp. NPDC005806]|uniref:hypothetical protein n=1 Tax=Micromonospora sp. NPDC005806 TaxID=3364234 RepID=UPI0036C340B9
MSESAATGQEPDPTSERLRHRGGGPSEPDVLLDLPEVTVDQIRLAVDGLDADLSLRARLANLVQLDAGVRVHLEGVELDVTGVSAEALLKVRLEKLVQILDRALATIDRNPQVIDALARTAATGLEDVNRAARNPEPPTGGAGPGQGAQAGKPSEGGPSGAAQLAGQAGETLRQAGRSVWEVIQAGMSQSRQQRPEG